MLNLHSRRVLSKQKWNIFPHMLLAVGAISCSYRSAKYVLCSAPLSGVGTPRPPWPPGSPSPLSHTFPAKTAPICARACTFPLSSRFPSRLLSPVPVVRSSTSCSGGRELDHFADLLGLRFFICSGRQARVSIVQQTI
jgi:hypothetical protein